jgi:hypothetical protein
MRQAAVSARRPGVAAARVVETIPAVAPPDHESGFAVTAMDASRRQAA